MRRFVVYFLLANLIGGLFLWLAARELPFGDIFTYLSGRDAGQIAVWSLVFLGLYIACHAARIFRWFYLVRPLGEVDAWMVHRICTVGFTAIMLLPLRLGELVRPYLLARRSHLKVTNVLGTAVVERVVDGLIITGILFVTLALYDGDRATAFAHTTGLISAAIFVPALTVCLLALWRRDWTVHLVLRIGSVVSETLAEKAAGLLDSFIDGFRALSRGKAMGRFLGLTTIYWFANGFSLWVLARFGFGLEIGILDGMTVLAILVIGIMIPAGPALAGNFEFFTIRGLGLFVAVEAAGLGARVAAFAALLHVLQFVIIVLPGFAVMWVDPEARHLIRLSQAAEEAVEDASERREEEL